MITALYNPTCPLAVILALFNFVMLSIMVKVQSRELVMLDVSQSTGMILNTPFVNATGNTISSYELLNDELIHCLMPYRNALQRAHGGAINSKLHHAPGCLSVIPDNTGVRSIGCIAAQIRSTNKHAVRKCDRERNGSIGSVYCTYIYPLLNSGDITTFHQEHIWHSQYHSLRFAIR